MNNCCIEYKYHFNTGVGEQTIYLSICSTIKEIWKKVNNNITNQTATENFWTDGKKKVYLGAHNAIITQIHLLILLKTVIVFQ